MPKLSQTEKAFLSRAGEFGTLSELLKRNLDARITIDNMKAMDIQVMYPDGNWKSIEVKTSRSNMWDKIVNGLLSSFVIGSAISILPSIYHSLRHLSKGMPVKQAG